MEIRVIADRWMMPERQHQDDAGADLKADATWRIEPGRTRMVGARSTNGGAGFSSSSSLRTISRIQGRFSEGWLTLSTPKEEVMEINDEKRREVASRMRDIMRRYPRCFLDNMVAQSVLDVMGDGVTIGGTVADLIDRPTCKNLAIKPADELLCSECGEHVDIAYMESADDYHARYCPNCGAEVCDDD